MKKSCCLLIALALMASCYAGKEKLELNLTKGETYTQKMVVNMSISMMLKDKPINLATVMNGAVHYKVTDSHDSIYEMEMRFDALSMTMKMPIGDLVYSSEKNDTTDNLSTVLKRITDLPLLVKMSKTGSIKEIKNMDSLITKALKELPNRSEYQKQQVADQLNQTFGERAFKDNMEMGSVIYSNAPVSEGDTWAAKAKLGMGLNGIMETTYKLEELTDTYGVISGTSTLQNPDNAVTIETNGIKMNCKIGGTMTSQIRFDKKTGWIITSNTNQIISGTFEVQDDPKMPGGAVIPITINNSITLSE